MRKFDSTLKTDEIKMPLEFFNTRKDHVQFARWHLRWRLRSLIIRQIILGLVAGSWIGVYVSKDPKQTASVFAVIATCLVAFVVFFLLFVPVKLYMLIPLSTTLRILTGRITLEKKVINYDETGLWFERADQMHRYEWNSMTGIHRDNDLMYVQFNDRKYLIIPREVLAKNWEFENLLDVTLKRVKI